MKKIVLLALVCLLSYASQAQLIINEVLYDPSNTALEGDANGDGVYDQTQDEFIEFLNAGSADLDVSRFRIYDKVLSTGLMTLRHTVDSGTVVPAQGALVVFGGGTAAGTFGGAIVKVDRGTQGLSLGNSGESIILTDSSGVFVDSMNTDALSNNPDESYTRNPDFTGAYVQHHLAQANVLFSPGTHIDGTPFAIVANRPHISTLSLSFYPNPSSGRVQLTGLDADNTLTVLDWTGKAVVPIRNGNMLDFTAMPAGLYAVSAQQKGKNYLARVLIAR